LLNAIGYQGIFEAAGHKLNDIGGVMLWKINAAFPSVVWQVYDWFLMPNAGYYFMQNACEPIHIQLNLNNLDVLAINRTYHAAKDLKAQIEVFDLNTKSLFREEKICNLTGTDVKQISSLAKVLENEKGVNFAVLNLKDGEGRIISHNVYWLSKDEDYTSMTAMAATDVKVEVLNKGKSKTENNWTIRITNSSDKLAFFIRPQLMANGSEVLPSFWSGSYFTLAPKESTTLTVSCPVDKIALTRAVLKVSGWNVASQEINL
jgi:hypothetical protein